MFIKIYELNHTMAQNNRQHLTAFLAVDTFKWSTKRSKMWYNRFATN